jgi:DNA-directed RNA polymerase II subunit RPB1
MSLYRELSQDQDIEKILGISFSVLSADEIVARSVGEIISTDTFSNGEPIIGGLFDPRMGVIDNNKLCKTCQNNFTFCPGHMAHIVLAKPVFYIQFFDTVRKLMKCICFRCSKILLDDANQEMRALNRKKLGKQKRFEQIYKLCSNKIKIKRCGQENTNGCGARLPEKITKDNLKGCINLEWKDPDGELTADVKKQCYFAEDILRIFQRITDEDVESLGFNKDNNRPENIICTIFPVPPPTVRPSVRNDTGQRCEDDLTHKLCDIVKANNTLKAKVKSTTVDVRQIEHWTQLLQYHVTTFVDNKIPSIPDAKQRTGRSLRSLTERLKSKEGRIRGNLMGKRVDFSARSVITPDPNISIDELGVPLKIAMNLTFPETVGFYNIERLQKAIENGPDNYPGAKYIRKACDNNRIVRLKKVDISTITLEIGDTVDRHLLNGDWVLFNRQPSLHRMSMQAHRVRVMPYDTFRLNASVTPSYNADKRKFPIKF